MTGSEMSDKEGEDKQQEGEGKGKIQQSLKSMLKQMELCDEEIKYRMENFENADMKEYLKYLKCTKCDMNFQKVINRGDTVSVHPLLGVLMCDSCCDYYGDGNFSLDSEGEDKYCRWCGEGGTIFVCSKCICGFCDECIRKNFGESALETVKNDDDWICYFCNPKPLWYLRSICSLVKEAARNKRDQLKKNKEGGSVRKKKRRKKESADNDTSKASSDCSSSSSNSSTYRKRKTRTRRVLRFSDRRKADSSSSGDEKENHINSKKRPVRSKKDSSDGDVKKESSESDLGNSKKKSKISKDEEDILEKRKKEFLKKLRSIWRLTQTITEVGFNSSRTKLKYLSKYDEFGKEKLQKEYEELKSCINVLTSSLSTASNSVNSIKEDLISGTTIDETERFRDEEIKLKRFADKFHGGKSDDDVTSVDSEGDSSRQEVKRRSEGRKKTSGCDGKRKSLRKSVKSAEEGGTKKKNSVSGLSDPEGEAGGSKGGSEKEGEENEEEKCDSDEDGVAKPFLKVKSFARMLDANAYDESIKEGDEPIVIDVYDLDTDEGEAVKKRSQGGEKKKNRSIGESKEKCEKESESPENGIKKKEKGKKSTEINQKISNDENGEEETVKTEIKGKSEKETEKQNEKSFKLNSELSENEEKENGISSNGKQEEDFESRMEEIIQKKNEEDDQESKSESKDLIENMEKGSESEHDEEKEKEKEEDSQNQQTVSCDQKESSENENEKMSTSIGEIEDSQENKSEEENEKNKNSEESNASDLSSSDKEKQRKRKTRGQKKELKASFEKFKRKRQRFLNSKENTEADKQDGKEEKKATKLLESSESENENKNKEAELCKNKKTKKRRILASSDEENDQKEEEEEKEKTSSEESDKELEAPKPTSEESSAEDEEEEKTKKRRRIKRKQNQNSDSSDEEKKKKKQVKSSSDSSEDEKEKKKKKGRRNIKKILKKDSLQVETKEALKNEEERKKRVKERQKLFEELFPQEEGTPKTIILDFNPETKEPLVTVHKKLAKRLKPHQVKGVRFMWDNCFESVQKLEEDTGSGCILAHCMGLGKTLQVITLVHTVMTHDLGVNTVLVVCPLSTVSNWIREFETWLGNIHTEPIILYDLLKYKKPDERVYQLKNWQEEGGVLVISYDLFRNLTKDLEKEGKKKKKKRRPKKQEVFESALLDPGPDLVICDEGHLLKNVDTALSKCMNRLKTSRRIVLTGTPLQNNLVEYHCMVQFVKPNILGTRKEFCNRFVNPINNGQFEDSTELDVKIMKRRSHVLHSMLDGCVQRFDYSVLTPFLPEKHEYGVMISLTDTQAKAYMHFINNLSAKSLGSSRATGLFFDFNCLQRIWTHPRSILMQSERETMKEVCGRDSPGSLKDFVVSTSEEEEEETGSESSSNSVQEIPQRKRVLRSNANDPEVLRAIEEEEKQLKKHWWDEFYEEKSYDDLRESNKLVLLFSLLKYCGEKKDKVLVFSQSLYSLDLIEYFLGKVDENRNENEETLCGHTGRWELGSDYFRLDGSTSSDTRAIWCKYFNKESNTRARLFLISTRAGGLGINLYGANRVVIFDASWNPSHDLQSIFRVYRFGQKKPCFIYRFLAEGTMEEKIYERQVTKLSLAHRVVDEHQIERHYTMGNLQELYTFQPTPKEQRKVPKVPKDSVLADLLTEHKELIVSYHEHDSLLENKQEEELSEEERKAAWKEYEEEKASKMINYNQMMEQMRMIQQGNMFQGMGPPFMFPGQVNPGENYVNPMYVPSNIPLEVIQRGLSVGLTPLPNEAVESFLTRIFQRECWMRGAPAKGN